MMKWRRNSLILTMILFGLSRSSLSPGEELTTSKKLEQTAEAWRALAEKKMIQASSEKAAAVKKKLMDEVVKMNRFADDAEKKSNEESLLEKNPEVIKAREDEAKTLLEIEKAAERLEETKKTIENQASGGVSTANADQARDCIKAMQTLAEKENQLKEVSQRRQAEEDKVKSGF